MGRKIAKQIRGMSGWAKGSLVLALTLMVSTFMYQGWFSPNNIDSATNTYRFYIDGTSVNVGVDGSTITTVTAGQNPGGKYSLSVSTYTNTTPYITVPASATTTLCTMYSPVYSANTALTAPVLRLAQRAGAAAGQTTAATVYDYDPVSGTNTSIWTATGANYTSTSTNNGYINLTFAATTAYNILHGHRVKIVVSATNNATSAGRLYFYSSATNSSYFTVSENYPTSTTYIANLIDYNGGYITNVTQGQQNVAVLSFQMLTNATSSTTWTGGMLDKKGTNVIKDDATFAIYFDSNNDGVFNPAVDQKISDDVTFTQTSGQSYSLVAAQTITSSAKRYFVVFNLSPAAVIGTTIGAQILDESYFTVGANNMNPMLSGASSLLSIQANDGTTAVLKTYKLDFNSGTNFTAPYPAASGATATNTTCSATATSYSADVYGLLNPTHTCTSPSATNYNTLTTTGSFILYFNGAGSTSDISTLKANSIIIGAGGTGAIVNAHLFYIKSDGTKVDFPAAYDGNTGTAFGSTTVAARTITFNANYFVSNVPKGSRLGVKLTTSGASARISLNSAVGAQLAVQETPTVNNGVDLGDGKVIPDGTVTAGTTGTVVDAFTMVAGTSQSVTSLTVTGSNANSTNISAVKIYRKNSGSTNYAAKEDSDVLVGSGAYSGASAVVSMTESEPVGATTNRYLVLYDIAQNAVVGQKITGLVTAVGGATADVIADTSSAGLTVVASTVITEGSGEPASVSVAPGSAAVNLDAFGLYTNGPADVINTVTFQLATGTSGAVALMEIVGRTSGTVYGSSTAPINNDTWRMTVAGLSATSATTQCYVRITPKASIAGTYYVTGLVTAISHVQTGNVLFYNDAVSSIVSIDGNAPPDPSLTAATGSTPGHINLVWNAVIDSNIHNNGISYKLVRGPDNSPAPADCSGTAVYQGDATTYDDNTSLTDGHSHTFGYRVCAIDGVGNKSTGSIASASAKLPKICNQTPTVAFIDSPNQYVKTGGSADVRLNIINNDIGDCSAVTFTVSLDGTPNAASFDPPTMKPATLTLGPNGAGANVKITIKSSDSAQQGDSESFIVKATAPGSGYVATAPTPLFTLVNNFGPMLHSSLSVGTKYGMWGTKSTCNDCHVNATESTQNIKLISQNVLTPLGRKPVNFSKITSSTATLGIFGNEQRENKTTSSNICEVCHHQTKFHQYSAVKQVAVDSPLTHHNGANCMQCHPHKGGFKYAGGAVDCVSCHGNPPTRAIEMVSPPINALGANPTDFGAHATHDRLKMTCDVCHNSYTLNPMGNAVLEMGFAIRTSTYRGFAGNVNAGAITVSSNYNTLYGWASNSPGTTIALSPNQSVPSCSVYCHGGWTGGGGTNPKPTWTGSNQAACGTCHNFTNANPPTTGSHLKHASSGDFVENSLTVGGLNMGCEKCHSSFNSFTSARHINGNVEWNLAAIAATATYRGSVSGGTGAIAPSASFGSCANLYCHSNVQGANGSGVPTAYFTPTWGGTATCGSCHVDMYHDPAATGGHKQHAQASPNFATPFDCRICHGTGGTTNPQNHANGSINMDFSGYGANTIYSLGTHAPGSGYGSCSAANCHGRRTIAWGPSSTLPLCDKCHGSKTSAGGFYTTSGPGTAANNTDPVVGAHNAHIHQVNSAFTLYTSYSAYKDCGECHIKPNGPYDAGHIDTALPAEVVFQPGAIANKGIVYGTTTSHAAYNSSNRTCNNVWCHGSAMDSNRGSGAYATVVADGGTLGKPTTPTWNQPFLNGKPQNDCTHCHSYPPPAPNESYSHFSHYSSDNISVVLKQPNECSGCHINVKSDGNGFINSATHINGTVEKGCQACHGVPPSTTANLAITSNGALAPGQAGAHVPHANLDAIGKNCAVCHYGYTTTMPSQTIEMGFNVFGGKATTGAFWGYSTVNNGLTTFVSSSPGTLVYQTNTLADQNTCAVYCHGLRADGTQIIGGRFGATAKPVWDSGASMVCGNCHGVNIRGSLAYAQYTGAMHVRPDSAPTTSSHPKHAGPTALDPAALNITCDTCHGVITNFNHVNGSVAWSLDTTNPKLGANAVYGLNGNQAVSGATGNLAPSSTYGSCSNVYCHSSGQSNDGASSIPVYANQQWGVTGPLTCNACHADMSTTGTGSHVIHAGTNSYDCSVCHGSGYLKAGVTAATHVDKLINVSMGNGVYSKGSTFDLGLGYGSCSSNNCHGQGSPTWGAVLYSASAQCDKCHAGPTYSGNFYSTSFPTKVTAATDPVVGAHTGHITAAYGYSGTMACIVCHPNVASVNSSGHMDGTVQFNATNVTYSKATGTCVTFCHGSNFTANQVGSNPNPVWKSGSNYLTGIPSIQECGTCHAFPPNNGSHTGILVTGNYSATVAKCSTCHTSIDVNGTFSAIAQHIDGDIHLAPGVVSGGGVDCSWCHTSLVGMKGDTTTYHHVLASTSVDYTGNTCLKCHVDHDIFQSSQNSANTVGVAANLRVDNSAAAPQVGDAPGSSYTNTDFVGTATNGGICVSCHQNKQIKNLVNQKNVVGFINGTTIVINKALYSGSMHNYTTSSTFIKDTSKFIANCSKCHSDTMAETKQVQPKTFGLHLSATRELFTAYGAATPTEAREDRLCFGCHSQVNDVVGSGQTIKPVNGKDWYGSRTMRSSSEDTFKSFSSSTRVFRHNVGKYAKVHSANESVGDLKANAHVECADCHSSHTASFGNHSTTAAKGTRGAVLANVLQGASGLTVTTWGTASPTTTWGDTNTYGQSGNQALPAATMEYQICFKCHAGAGFYTGGSNQQSFTNLAIEFNPNNVSRHPIGTALTTSYGIAPNVMNKQLLPARLSNGWTPGSIMTCSDCHATDSTASKGPHGSAVKWMLAGVNKAWPYTSAALNGTLGSDTTGGDPLLYTLGNCTSVNVGTVDGLFCLNCHSVKSTNAFHVAVNGFAIGGHSSWRNAGACAGCHIRVPHGGKVSRLLSTVNAPSRYKTSGSALGNGSAVYFSSWQSMGSNTTDATSGRWTGSCGTHSGGTESW